MFGPKTVDSVLKVFTQALDDLAVVEKQQSDVATAKRGEIARLTSEAGEAEAEGLRASVVARKLRAVIS